jgi:membrane dipeptidase
MFIIDAHEDLAWNIQTFGRDYSRGALWIRAREAGAPASTLNGNTLLGKAEWLLGRVGLIFSTLFVAPAHRRLGGWDTQCYSTASEAAALASAQLDAYCQLAEAHPQFRMVAKQDDLEQVVASWEPGLPLENRRIGLVPLMEGADAIQEPEQAEGWFERGVRVVGLAWERTRYAGGTHEPGSLTPDGARLLGVMAELGMILDLSHMAEEAYFEALERYTGVVIASHSNPRRFCPTARGLSDRMIVELAERDGVAGIVPYNAFLKPGWRKGDRKEDVTLIHVVDAIDHVCQVTGSAWHVGLGTDFDGGFGVEHVPAEIDTIADLLELEPLLAARGFSEEQIEAIYGGNWLRVLRAALPA